MSGLRLILITRRFWPLVGGAEVVMSNLARAFREQGASATILTAQWEPHWPADVLHREVPVVRLPQPRQRGWGTVRYMAGLGRWLRAHRDQYDLVYVSMLKHDAYAALNAVGSRNVPVVLRAEGAGETGDCHWHETARFGRRIRRRCFSASAVVAPSNAIAAELREAGFSASQICEISNGVAIPPPRSARRQTAARHALAEVNHDLATAPGAPVVVYTGRLHRAKGLFELVRAWPPVLQRWPEARLWLVGEGPDRESLFELVSDLGLRQRVILPGAFDDIEEVLQAADAFVLPSYEEGMSLSLLEAMAAGLPVAASDIEGNRRLVVADRQGRLVPPRCVEPWSDALIDLLGDPQRASALGASARRLVELHYSLAGVAQRHLRLFESLLERQPTSDA